MKGRRIRQKGKISFSQWFKKVNKGDRVSIVKNPAVRSGFPKRVVGLSGIVKEDRGSFKLVDVKDGNKIKTFIIHPIHLRKLK